jgi:CubicO group peptidase (beta-lactamase class C family)
MKSRIGKAVATTLGVLVAILAFALVAAMVAYSPQYVLRVLAWQESDAFDWQKFPPRQLQPAGVTSQFDERLDDRVPALFQNLAGVADWDSFMESTETQAFIVLQDGEVLYERYFNDTQRDSIVTSFSVAKSFTSALIGIAIGEGFIGDVNDPVPNYLPELAERDPRFEEITIRNLLMMSSGLDYQANRSFLFNGDDPLTTYYPDQRQISLDNTQIIDPPGRYFLYNKYHPQLLGMVLERSTGIPVTEYLQTRIWDPLGMEFGGSWSLDSEKSGFEKMESGVNARAIDFAKFGQLYLNNGHRNGIQVIPAEWVTESTQVDPSIHNDAYYPEGFGQSIYDSGQGYYKYMWYGFSRGEGGYDFAARGDRGQYIYVSPHKNLIIVRNGVDYGIPSDEWIALFYKFATDF